MIKIGHTIRKCVRNKGAKPCRKRAHPSDGIACAWLWVEEGVDDGGAVFLCVCIMVSVCEMVEEGVEDGGAVCVCVCVCECM